MAQSKEAKTERIDIRLKPCEKQALYQFCKKQGVTVSEYIRSCILKECH